MAVYFLWHYP